MGVTDLTLLVDEQQCACTWDNVSQTCQPAPTPTPLPSWSWGFTPHPRTNCFNDHGGKPTFDNPEDLPRNVPDVNECEYQCRKTQGCTAVVVNDATDGTSHQCWLRESVDISLCEHGGGYTTYVAP